MSSLLCNIVLTVLKLLYHNSNDTLESFFLQIKSVTEAVNSFAILDLRYSSKYRLIHIFSVSTLKFDCVVYEYNSGYKGCICPLDIPPFPNHSTINLRSETVRGVIYFNAI